MSTVGSLLRSAMLAAIVLSPLMSPTEAMAGGCAPSSGKPAVAVAGAWVISSYHEIHGDKGYMEPGDYVMVYETVNRGHVCVEFTQPIEGGFSYVLATDVTGAVIDDTVIAPSGRELRVLMEAHKGGMSLVLYANGTAASQMEGNPDDNGGALASGGRP